MDSVLPTDACLTRAPGRKAGEDAGRCLLRSEPLFNEALVRDIL